MSYCKYVANLVIIFEKALSFCVFFFGCAGVCRVKGCRLQCNMVLITLQSGADCTVISGRLFWLWRYAKSQCHVGTHLGESEWPFLRIGVPAEVRPNDAIRNFVSFYAFGVQKRWNVIFSKVFGTKPWYARLVSAARGQYCNKRKSTRNFFTYL